MSVRTKTAGQPSLNSCDGARYVVWTTPESGNSVLETQTYTNPAALTKHVKEQLVPPYHWHWYQEECFVVKQGRFVFTMGGRDTVVSSTDPNPRVTIPPGATHTFAPDTTCHTPCVIEIRADTSPISPSDTQAADFGVSERFFRNLYSYLEDCNRQKKAPSLPQLLLFLDSAEVSLAWDVGPQWLMKYMSWGLGVVVGRWLGGYVLGLKDSYPEYYNPALGDGKKER